MISSYLLFTFYTLILIQNPFSFMIIRTLVCEYSFTASITKVIFTLYACLT